MNTQPYPTDMTDAQWALVQPLIPGQHGAGRPRVVDLRVILNGIFYLTRSGCQWRMLPRDFGRWITVHYYFAKWKKDGTFDRIHDALREQVRQRDRPRERTTACFDSQTTDSHGAREARAYDGGKKLDGRKRHLIVDSLGLLLAVVVTAANVTDAQGGMAALDLLDPRQYRRVKTAYGDRAYEKEGFPQVVAQWQRGCRLNVIARDDDAAGFVKLPIRWVVERTNAWVTKNRRLCRSYEHTVGSEEALIKVGLIQRMMRRLSPSPPQSPYRYPRKEVAA